MNMFDLDNLPDWVTESPPQTSVYTFLRYLHGHCFLFYNLLISIVTRQCLRVMGASKERWSSSSPPPFPKELQEFTKSTIIQHSKQSCRCLPFFGRDSAAASVGKLTLKMAAYHLTTILPELGLLDEYAWVNKIIEESKLSPFPSPQSATARES